MSKPEKVFKAGAIRASVFCNYYEKNGQQLPIRKVVIEVRYRDKNGQWKGSNSLSMNELPKAITALQQAYEYLLSAGSQEGEQSSQDKGASNSAPGNPKVVRTMQT